MYLPCLRGTAADIRHASTIYRKSYRVSQTFFPRKTLQWELCFALAPHSEQAYRLSVEREAEECVEIHNTLNPCTYFSILFTLVHVAFAFLPFNVLCLPSFISSLTRIVTNFFILTNFTPSFHH